MTTSLTCPKCGAEMRHYERNRVLVDQCVGCGGLFLDRGELESLIAAENAWHSPQPAAGSPQDQPRETPQQYAPPPQQPYVQQPQQPYPPQQQPYAQPYGRAPYVKHSKAPYGSYSRDHYGRRRKRSFLSELFDD